MLGVLPVADAVGGGADVGAQRDLREVGERYLSSLARRDDFAERGRGGGGPVNRVDEIAATRGDVDPGVSSASGDRRERGRGRRSRARLVPEGGRDGGNDRHAEDEARRAALADP